MDGRCQKASDDGSRYGLHYIRTHARGPHNGNQTDQRCPDSHQLGTEPEYRTLHRRLVDVLLCDLSFRKTFVQSLVKVDDHHYTGFHRYPVEGNVAHPDRHAEIISKEALENDATDQRPRHRRAA
mgnify:CR=1 FL=1